MGGTIGASSELGRGSTFWVELSLPEVATTQTVPVMGRGERVVRLSERRSNPDAALVLVGFHWKHMIDSFFYMQGGARHFGVGLGTFIIFGLLLIRLFARRRTPPTPVLPGGLSA